MNTKIKLLFDRKGCTQQEMSKAVGVRYEAVGKWLRGQTTPYGRNLEAIADYFGVPVGELVNAPASQDDTELNALRLEAEKAALRRKIAEDLAAAAEAEARARTLTARAQADAAPKKGSR